MGYSNICICHILHSDKTRSAKLEWNLFIESSNPRLCRHQPNLNKHTLFFLITNVVSKLISVMHNSTFRNSIALSQSSDEFSEVFSENSYFPPNDEVLNRSPAWRLQVIPLETAPHPMRQQRSRRSSMSPQTKTRTVIFLSATSPAVSWTKDTLRKTRTRNKAGFSNELRLIVRLSRRRSRSRKTDRDRTGQHGVSMRRYSRLDSTYTATALSLIR